MTKLDKDKKEDKNEISCLNVIYTARHYFCEVFALICLMTVTSYQTIDSKKYKQKEGRKQGMKSQTE
jgi:hypothetical protein